MSNTTATVSDKNPQKKKTNPKLTGTQKNILISLHVAVSGIWLGTALCLVIMAWNDFSLQNGDELYGVNSILELLDQVVIIPAATASVLTGTLLCWLTVWGFFKFYWVIVKWVATTTLIIFGTLWLDPWTKAMTSISDTERLKALTNPLFMFDLKAVIIGGIVQTVCLVAIIFISILKPWGRRDVKPKASS